MARNKNSTALFDVIHAAKRPPKASPSASIPTPRWWGKDRKDKKVPQPLANASSENVGRQQSWLTAAKKNGVTPLATPPASVESSGPAESAIDSVQTTPVEVTAETAKPIQPKQSFIDRLVNRAAATATNADKTVSTEAVADPTAPAVDVYTEQEPARHATEYTTEGHTAEEQTAEWTDSEFVQVKPTAKPQPSRDAAFRVDSSAKEFSFRLSYGGLIAIAFIVVMALAIAFIAGQHSGRETAEGVDASTSKSAAKTGTQNSGLLAGVAASKPGKTTDNGSRAGGVNPNVLDVSSSRTRPTIPAEKNTANTNPPAPALLPMKNTREIGLMYVIIQSYDDQELAQKACDYITKNSDLKCTVVQGPGDWAPRNWYSVIGLQPFAKRDPALSDYVRKVRTVGSHFSSNVLNQFDPKPYTWRADSVDASGDEGRWTNSTMPQ